MIQPGLVFLQGNRLEWLAEAVFGWLDRAPLGPLEAEVVLVQSNGTAEWLKAQRAQQAGICAALRTELPARFVWRTYRAMLGAEAAPPQSPLDKAALRWRLVAGLPAVAAEPGFEPLARYLVPALAQGVSQSPPELSDSAATRRWLRLWHLAGAVADLYDQYQVYRADWLDAWAQGRDVLLDARGQATPLPADQHWQALLWRQLLAGLDDAGRAAARPAVHARFLQALRRGDAPVQPLPRRVVVFGIAHLPLQTLQALMALSTRCQVLVAAPNPCRFHWADIIDGREWFAGVARRQAQRGGTDFAALPLHAAQPQAHPLLAAWGRQGRDFMRLLDGLNGFDSGAGSDLARIDLFDDTPPAPNGSLLAPLLAQVQAAVRDLLPLAEHPRALGRVTVAARDRSVMFLTAHSPQREVEVLHEQLLHLLAEPPRGEPLAPRQIVVMVPDLAPFEAAIHAVFGQYPASDARHIPYSVADLGPRGREPLLVALEWLLAAPEPRCTASELRDLLDVPALARRFGLRADDLPQLMAWITGAGVRWGLDAAHRASLGLASAGALNTWAFGLERMLLGYASGAGPAFGGTEPYAEVGGLEAASAGALAALVEALQGWWQAALVPRTPPDWADQFRMLLQRFFAVRSEGERLALAALDDAFGRWLSACDAAGFDAPVPLAVARDAWLGALDEPSLSQRFAGGGVTFCTLMPMRTVPFEVVCLLGMNEGDYPRRTPRADFDLMHAPGARRAGDRAARDDDRYLMLEALLAARRVFYVSWCGRSVRDNQAEPPSVLVGELRDYLEAGFDDGGGTGLAGRLTTAHPLQPFSRRYFEPGAADAGLISYAREWRAAHDAAAPGEAVAVAPFDLTPLLPVTLARLADFLKNPVRHHYRWRLGVVFDEAPELLADDEPFGFDRLEESLLLREVLEAAASAGGVGADVDADALTQATLRLQRSGVLPLGAPGAAERAALQSQAAPMWAAWQSLLAAHPPLAEPRALHAAHPGQGHLVLDDALTGLSADLFHTVLRPSRLRSGTSNDARKTPRADKLIDTWVLALAASAAGTTLRGAVVACDTVLQWRAPDPADAQVALADLLHLWQAGLHAPLPVACRSALAFLAEGEVEAAEPVYQGTPRAHGEVDEPSLARSWPDFGALIEAAHPEGGFESLAERLYGSLARWATECVTLVDLPAAAVDDAHGHEPSDG
jgi:exodeoxyribonuclease V gamma subunit